MKAACVSAAAAAVVISCSNPGIAVRACSCSAASTRPDAVSSVSVSCGPLPSSACVRSAQAVLNYYIYETPGPNVIVQASGSLLLPAVPDDTYPCGVNGALAPSSGFVCTGIDTNMSIYAIIGSPGFSGSQDIYPASSVSGLSTGMNPSVFGVDPTYVSGSPIVSSATFGGQTLLSFGYTSPGLLGTWTLSGTGDTINLCVGNPGSPCSAPTPGPLPLFGAAAAFGYSRRLRRRVNQAPASAPLSGTISA